LPLQTPDRLHFREKISALHRQTRTTKTWNSNNWYKDYRCWQGGMGWAAFFSCRYQMVFKISHETWRDSLKKRDTQH
jgi:hypothetical protein